MKNWFDITMLNWQSLSCSQFLSKTFFSFFLGGGSRGKKKRKIMRIEKKAKRCSVRVFKIPGYKKRLLRSVQIFISPNWKEKNYKKKKLECIKVLFNSDIALLPVPVGWIFPTFSFFNPRLPFFPPLPYRILT